MIMGRYKMQMKEINIKTIVYNYYFNNSTKAKNNNNNNNKN